MEEVEVWLARDSDGILYVYEDKPEKNIIKGEWKNFIYNYDSAVTYLSDEIFPSVKWEDKEPTKAKITLIK